MVAYTSEINWAEINWSANSQDSIVINRMASVVVILSGCCMVGIDMVGVIQILGSLRALTLSVDTWSSYTSV